MRVAVNSELYRWHHMCMAVNLTTQKYWLAHDDMVSMA